MACQVTINSANEELGTYGIYNSNAVFIENISGSTTNLKFRVRITDADGNTYTQDVVPNSDNNAIIDPFIRLRDTFFSTVYTNFSELVNDKGWNTVTIECGEISGTPPAFNGYDTSDTIVMHNGYSKGVEQQNGYREPGWYTDSTDFLLPKVKKTVYLQENDIEIISIPNQIVSTAGTFSAEEANWSFFSADGTLLGTNVVDLTLEPEFSSNPIGYWLVDMNNAGLYSTGADYGEYYVSYNTGGSEPVPAVSETITMIPQVCQPKYDYFRLTWFNRWGGVEHQNFLLRRSESIQIDRGRKILSDGNDYSSASYSAIKNVNNPQITEFGKSYDRQYTLRSNWLTQEEISALEECMTSPAVIMNDSDGALFGVNTPVIVLDNSYEIVDVTQGLKKVEVRVQVANRQPSQIQ